MAKFIPALTLAVCLASANALHAQEMTKPLGQWQRKVGKNSVTLIIEDNRLHIIRHVADTTGTVHADYAMTGDGVIYGVVTSIECEENEEAEANKLLFDAPFSFRFRIDEGALIIHDAKAHDAGSGIDPWNGRFKAISPVTGREPIVPTSYTVPSGYTFPFNTPAPAPANTPSSLSPKGVQTFQFWTGFSR